MRGEPRNPVGKRNDIVVPIFLVHGSKYLREFLVDGWVVATAPVQQGVFSSGIGNEPVGAASEHDAGVLAN